MKNNFNDKMAQFQQYQQPATLQPISNAGQNNRITVYDVHARLLSSAVFGFLVFMIATSISALVKFPWWLSVGGGVFCGLAVFAFFFHSELEDAKQYQAPFFPLISEPQRTVTTINGEMKTGSKTTRIEFEADPEAVARFARKVTKFGAGFSEKTAQKAGITQPQWEGMRDQFIERGWAAWKNPAWHRAGIELTDTGRKWLEEAAGE
jgi:hypothetical protein